MGETRGAVGSGDGAAAESHREELRRHTKKLRRGMEKSAELTAVMVSRSKQANTHKIVYLK